MNADRSLQRDGQRVAGSFSSNTEPIASLSAADREDENAVLHSRKHPIVALTGGIGAGKSHVCQTLRQYGIEVYDCDAAAKRLMRESESLRTGLRKLIGEQVYEGETLQKRVVADFLLAGDDHLKALNDLIHPAVAADFMATPYRWIESAILFDSGFVDRIPVDYIVGVRAPEAVRLERIMRRDAISESMARQWMARQLPQDEVMARCHYVVDNDGRKDLDKQIESILHQLKLI